MLSPAVPPSRRPAVRRAQRAVLAAALAAALAGCNRGDGPPLAEVTGQVTFNGRPAPAEVVFEPTTEPGRRGGRPSSAWTRSDGTFRLSFTASRFGAIPGPHRVTIRVLREGKPGELRSFEEATNPTKLVRLERTIPAGGARFDFPIQW